MKPLFARGWEVTEMKDAEKFFSALTEILPTPVTLCFEGTSISPDVLALFASNTAAPTLEIPPGTIWPKPGVLHVCSTEQFLHQLTALATRHATPEICDHFHAYSESQSPLQWYDAFSDDPLLIGDSILEAQVDNFCRNLGVHYATWRVRAGRK